ncbi:MAG TPA: hypothetical protein VHV78_08865 [Gemmatimonadaceae bacterium]|jgi:hypothetical protein|nr:hypothetical protein [Gemmatimonadaceae bacterium]
MKRAFKYDVAITAADFDALAVTELKRRLEQRLSKAVYAAPRTADHPQTAPALAAVRKAIEKESRVVVVLYQRLWINGVGPLTTEAAAVKARVGNLKRKDVLIVPVDTTPIPSWLKGTVVKSSGAPTGSAVIDAIVEAVVAAGGTPKRMTDATVAARDAEEDRRARARTTFLTSQRALTLINRELDSLSATVLKLCETPGTLPSGVAAETRRTPDRYTVQIGPVGLSFSWIRGRSNSIADGQLLVIEWSGQLGDQHASADPRTAMPALEHVLQPHATSPEDWQWRRTDLDLCCYTTRDLAAQCVTSVVQRLPSTAAT